MNFEDTVINMLKKQEENFNERLDSIENKIDKNNVDILDQLERLDDRVKSGEKSADFILTQYDSEENDQFLTQVTNVFGKRKRRTEKSNHVAICRAREA